MATRLYLHNALFDTVTYPGSYPNSTTDVPQEGANWPVSPAVTYSKEDETATHRTLNKTKGTTAVNKDWNSSSSTLTQMNYITKFISEPLQGISSITAQQWVGQMAYYESSLNANVTFLSGELYVWRPSTDAIVGFIYSYTAFCAVMEPGAANSYRLSRANFSAGVSTLVSNVQDGDVIVMTVFSRHQQSASSVYGIGMQYDGPNEYTGSANNTVINADFSAWIETPQDLTFVTDVPQTIDATSDWKDILKQRPQQLITNSI